MGSDGTELGLLYNITMDLKSGKLNDLVIEPDEELSRRAVDFDLDDAGHFLVPVNRVQAVKTTSSSSANGMYVLDSSAFIHDFHTTEQTATIPLVREELEDESAYRYDAMEGSRMHVHIPNDDTTEKVERAARVRRPRGPLRHRRSPHRGEFRTRRRPRDRRLRDAKRRGETQRRRRSDRPRGDRRTAPLALPVSGLRSRVRRGEGSVPDLRVGTGQKEPS